MAYTKCYRLMGITIIVLVTLNGCTSLKLQPEPEAATTSEDGQILQLIPDPYLEQNVNIPLAAKTQFDSALAAMESKDWANAELQLSTMTKTYPELSGPYVNLGIALWQQNKLEKASNAFNQAIDANSLNGDAYLQFALMLREQGQFTDAEALYQHAIKIWPHNQQAHINLGILYDLYMGQFAKAVKHYETAQNLYSKPDRKLAGWILDTKRRVSKASKIKANEQKVSDPTKQDSEVNE